MNGDDHEAIDVGGPPADLDLIDPEVDSKVDSEAAAEAVAGAGSGSGSESSGGSSETGSGAEGGAGDHLDGGGFDPALFMVVEEAVDSANSTAGTGSDTNSPGGDVMAQAVAAAVDVGGPPSELLMSFDSDPESDAELEAENAASS